MPILAVSTITRAGNQVSFGPRGGVIHNPKTGRRIAVVRKDGIYVLEILVAPPVGRSALGKSERPLARGKAGQGERVPAARPGKPVLATEAVPAPRGPASPPLGKPGWQARLESCAPAEAGQVSGGVPASRWGNPAGWLGPRAAGAVVARVLPGREHRSSRLCRRWTRKPDGPRRAPKRRRCFRYHSQPLFFGHDRGG